MGREYPLHPIPAVSAVVLSDDASSIALVRRANPPSQGEWALPGGILELGETLETCLMREVLEETGMHVEPVAVVDVLDHVVKDSSDGVRFHYVLISFVCRRTGGVMSSASDAVEGRWVSRERLETNGMQLPLRMLQVIKKHSGWPPKAMD